MSNLNLNNKQNTIYRNALITQISCETSQDIKVVSSILDTLQKIVLDNANKNINTHLNGFVSFEVINVAPRKGKDKNNQTFTIPGSKRIDARVRPSFQEKIIQDKTDKSDRDT